MEQQREFKGVWIEKEIWLDKRLNALEKVILTEIDSLDSEEKGCYASNQYLAEFCQCSETKVSTAIKKLIELGYIYVKSFDGRIRILKSRLSKFERQDLKNLKTDIKNFKENNINNNKDNIDNNIYSEIVDYLNEVAGTNYKSTTGKTRTLIKARLNEKFTLTDFKTVINRKCAYWKGTEFEKYLRPETLFGNKFESYLNERTTVNKIGGRDYDKEILDALFDSLDNVDV